MACFLPVYWRKLSSNLTISSPMLRLGVRKTAATASRSASLKSGEDMGTFVLGASLL